MFFLNLALASLEVHYNQLKSAARQKRLAEQKLVEALRHAALHVPYYREAFRKAGITAGDIRSAADLKRLPFITKDEVRHAFPDTIVAEGTDISQCHYSATTGSTGRSLPFIYAPRTFAFYLATNLRVYTMIGYRPWYRTSYIKYTAMDSTRIGPFFGFDHISSILPVEAQIEKLKENRPDFIDGYASIILEIAKRVTPADLEQIRPRMILLNSEMSTIHQRQFIAETFGCPVYDEYSTEETWMVASQCRHHNYHIFTDNVWVEFLDPLGNDVPPGEPGEMVLTTLRSPAMPFIRYRIGDIGSMSWRKCPCGSPFPILESFEGRADDSFILPDGRFVSSLKILNTFTMYINKYLHLMEEFRVIQQKPDQVHIDLVKGKEYQEERFREVTGALSRILGDAVTIDVEIVDRIDNGGKIKRKAIESRVKPGDLGGAPAVSAPSAVTGDVH